VNYVLQCFVAMSRLNLSGFRQTPANVQHAGNSNGYWVLFTPAKTSKHRLKALATILHQPPVKSRAEAETDAPIPPHP
jgi:hypothetical protein